jgi:decaprenylphospho-beta-D-ribofuranose 2-oxidase
VIRLIPVETSWMSVETRRFGDLSSLMAEMERSDREFRYSVAWVDTTPGRSLGRGLLTRGDHAPLTALSRSQAHPAWRLPRPPRLKVPIQAPRGLMNPASISLFNELWFRRARHDRAHTVQAFGTFFHPLDGVADWNLLYGPAGFVQYQFCVGPQRGDIVADALHLLADDRLPAFLGVLKRFGPGNPGPLSFPMEGWTLAVDLPVGPPKLRSALDRLDDLVAAAGGRVYLAKDARVAPAHLDAMYPRLAEFTATRRRVDPDGVFRSDQSRRLGWDDATS